MGRKPKTPEEVFLSIDMRGGDTEACWEWTKSLSGRDDRPYYAYEGKRVLAYRLVYELVHGPIPDGHVIRHKCDNPKCCNPYHLETGTRADNEKDKYERDRTGTPKEIVEYVKDYYKLEPNATSARVSMMVKQKFDYDMPASTVRSIKTGYRREEA